jgi:hypothetical protein
MNVKRQGSVGLSISIVESEVGLWCWLIERVIGILRSSAASFIFVVVPSGGP